MKHLLLVIRPAIRIFFLIITLYNNFHSFEKEYYLHYLVKIS